MDEVRTQMQVMGYLFNKKTKPKQQQKLPHREKNRTAGRLGKAGTGYTQGETMMNWQRTSSSSLNLLAVDKQQNSVFPPPTGMECGSK